MKTLFITDDVELYERLMRNVAPNGDFMVARPYTHLCGVGFDRVVVAVGSYYVRNNYDRFAAWLTDGVAPWLLQNGRISMPREMYGLASKLGLPEA